jgi:hypothetical protein
MDSEKKRKVIEISELSWKSRCGAARKGGLLWEGDGDSARVEAAYAFDEKKKGHSLLLNGNSHVLEVFGERFGRSERDAREEIERRAGVLERLAAEGKTGFAEVGKAVSEYRGKEAG